LKKRDGKGLRNYQNMTSINYDTIFISHANPEDNLFAGWLASKLTLFGYKVWCDLDVLRGGEDFWEEIANTIREKTIKFLFLASRTSIGKNGTLKELAIADRIIDRDEFILPIRIDDVSYNDMPAEIIRLMAIDFSSDWALGLEQLIKKLEKTKIRRQEKSDSSMSLDIYHSSLSLKNHQVIQGKELYISNWFKIKLPKFICVHIPKCFYPIEDVDYNYPFTKDKDIILSFSCESCFSDIRQIEQESKIDLNTFLSNHIFQTASNRKIKETNKKVINLLNQTFSKFLRLKGLREYRLSGKKKVYYFPFDMDKKRISLKKYGKSNIQLAGTHKNHNWHFAINAQAFLYPFPAYFITYHVVFLKNRSFVEKGKQHSLRRSIGKNWYNKKWRDLILGAMLLLSKKEHDDTIDIPVCCGQKIKVNNYPLSLESPVGYIEPDTKASKWN
jgi:TIR domain